MHQPKTTYTPYNSSKWRLIKRESDIVNSALLKTKLNLKAIFLKVAHWMIIMSSSFSFHFQSVSLNALDIGLSNEASGIVRIEPAVPPTPTVTIRVSVARSVTVFIDFWLMLYSLVQLILSKNCPLWQKDRYVIRQPTRVFVLRCHLGSGVSVSSYTQYKDFFFFKSENKAEYQVLLMYTSGSCIKPSNPTGTSDFLPFFCAI